MTRLLSVAADASFTELLERALSSESGVQIQRWPGSLIAVGTIEAMASRRPDVIVIGPGVTPELAFSVAAKLEKAAPTISVVVAAPPSAATWRAAVESGVRSVIDPVGSDADVLAGIQIAIESSRRLKGDNWGAGASHRVIVMTSPKGGVGKTMLTTNTAIALAALTDEPVAVVDLDLEFGDTTHHLMLTPTHSMAEAADELPNLDLTALKVYLATHPAGIYCLPAPEDAAMAGRISPADSASIVDLLAAEFPYVLIDTAAGLDDHALSAMEHASDVVLLSDMDVPSVHNVRKAVGLLDVLGITDHTRHFVLNRADSKVGLRVAEVATATGLTIDIEIPSSRQVPLSVNEGRPIVLSRPRSPVSRRIVDLARRLQVQKRDTQEGST